MGKAPYVLIGSFVLCLLSGLVLPMSTWAVVFSCWKYFAAGTIGFILGKVFH